MPLPFLRMPGASKGDEGGAKKSQLEAEIEKRGKAELTPARDVVPSSDKKTYRDERGVLEFQEVEAVVTRNCHMDFVDGTYVIAPAEGRKYLEGGEAKVSVIDTAEARVVMVFRPSDEHFSQDAVGVSLVKDAEGALRVGTTLSDGKTKVKVSAALSGYVPYGEDRVYYSRAEQYAAFSAGYFPRGLACGLRQNQQTGQYEGGSARLVTKALGEIDRLNSGKTDATPYGLERELGGMPWGTAVVQMASMRLGGGQMAIEVMNLGKADDLGENALLQSPGAISKMGNTVGDRPLEIGRFGTPQGFKAERLLAASRAGSRGGVAVVTEQIFAQVSDGFTLPKGGIRVNGSTVSVEQFLSLPAEDLVTILQQNATAVFGNEKAPHDDGTMIAVIPRSVLKRNGFDYAGAYAGVLEKQAQVVGPVAALAQEKPMDEAAQVATAVLGQIIQEAKEATPDQIAQAVAQSEGVVAGADGPSPQEIAGEPASATTVPSQETTVPAEPPAVAVQEVQPPIEQALSPEVVQALVVMAQRLGVALEGREMSESAGAVVVDLAGHLESKLAELKRLVELGWTRGTVQLDEMAKLFELEIDPATKQVAIDRAKAKAAEVAQHQQQPAQQPQQGKPAPAPKGRRAK